MKKEGGQGKSGIESKYGLDKIPESKFKEKILLEFMKYDKKLIKIVAYEEKAKQGETLSDEMKGLVGKKQEITSHLTSLTRAIEIYAKAGETDKDVHAVPSKDTKAGFEERLDEFLKTGARRLGLLLASGALLRGKDQCSGNPFRAATIPNAGQQAVLQKLCAALIRCRQDQDTSLAEEASRATSAIYGLLAKSTEVFDAGAEGKMRFAEIAEVLDKIAESKPLTDARFKLAPKSKSKSASIPVAPPKEAPAQQYSVIPAVSVGQTVQAKEAEKPVVPAVVPQSQSQMTAQAPERSDWADHAEDEDEVVEAQSHSHPSQHPAVPAPAPTATATLTSAPAPGVVEPAATKMEEVGKEPEAEEGEDDDGFTIVKDKKTIQEERKTGGRPRGRGRRRPRYWGDEYQGRGHERGRGYRGEPRERGEVRGRPSRRPQ